LGGVTMTAGQAEAAVSLLKAIADPVRLRLMSIIAAADETCVCELSAEFDVTQPTISHHLRVLREAGWVDSERRGTWVDYRPRQEAINALGGLFSGAAAHA
jgi:ArsR family transcriptional regulator, arsenate/arsenite/antimonite-responsive transcriptional repressor